MSARGAKTLRGDAHQAIKHAEIVVAIGDADQPRTLLDTEYRPTDDRYPNELLSDYSTRLNARFTDVLRLGLAPSDREYCFGIALVWNQESVAASAYEHWMLEPSQREVTEACTPPPPTVDDEVFGVEYHAGRIPDCLGALQQALRPRHRRMQKADVRDYLKAWARAASLPTDAARWGRRVPGLLRVVDILRSASVQSRIQPYLAGSAS